MKLVAALFALFAVAAAAPARVTYDGVRVLRVPVHDETEVQKLNALIEKLNLETWTSASHAESFVDVQVPKAQLNEFAQEFPEYTTMHEDLGASIRAESEEFGTYRVGLADQSWFNAYHSHDQHLQFLRDLVTTYPANSEIITAGTSVQGRTITGIHIYGSGGSGSKPAIIFHGNVHAREWITSKTTEYIAYQLLSNYANSTEVKGYVDSYDFYIIPVVNPDGFTYSQTTDRLWRKNRQTVSTSTCVGRDMNRNWPWKWDLTGGASTSPCAETYKGLAAGDTPEIQGLVAFSTALAKKAAGAKLYIDWHSYGQYYMSPYGYVCSAPSADAATHLAVGRAFASAVSAVYGTTYTVGPICQTLYAVTGDAVDYHYEAQGITHSYTVELRDRGSYGFVLPANQIRPTGEESWAGVKALLKTI